jgi:hypothetical protein
MFFDRFSVTVTSERHVIALVIIYIYIYVYTYVGMSIKYHRIAHNIGIGVIWETQVLSTPKLFYVNLDFNSNN